MQAPDLIEQGGGIELHQLLRGLALAGAIAAVGQHIDIAVRQAARQLLAPVCNVLGIPAKVDHRIARLAVGRVQLPAPQQHIGALQREIGALCRHLRAAARKNHLALLRKHIAADTDIDRQAQGQQPEQGLEQL
ncbi:hypothetical protein SDC9_164613 [bioreactor metagenome]|uniref:Uncharacterized protein n=1 Tax=bioreactor metagenome TaxID=1076179 RepID=A0A645FTL4_9ZZZZ